MPDMQFFGLIYGRECYCSHYYKKTTGEGTCDLPCEGEVGVALFPRQPKIWILRTSTIHNEQFFIIQLIISFACLVSMVGIQILLLSNIFDNHF